jgi:hypothetical protein
VVDQFFSFWIKNIPVRQIYHFTKTNDSWLCDFSSLALIPTNEDLSKMLKAMN